jgi:hypothetical protein
MSLTTSPGILRMIRKNAAQHYELNQAVWGISVDLKYSVPVLQLAVKTESQKSIFADDEGWNQSPTWHIDIWLRGLRPELLQPGCLIRIPDSNDNFTGMVYTDFYYDEHEGTTENSVKITGRQGDTLQLSMEGHIRHSFASMPPTKIVVDAAFTFVSQFPSVSTCYHREALPPHEPPYGATIHPASSN